MFGARLLNLPVLSTAAEIVNARFSSLVGRGYVEGIAIS
jgi:hypothetical protein